MVKRMKKQYETWVDSVWNMNRCESYRRRKDNVISRDGMPCREECLFYYVGVPSEQVLSRTGYTLSCIRSKHYRVTFVC